MKKQKVFLLFFFLIAVTLHAQEERVFRELTPARGHYKSLSAFSPKPVSANETIDQDKFHYDQAQAEKRLSLKPHYLQNVKPEDFIVPAPPANSSEQTRAEINYLLSLQYQRTSLDIESSLHMAGIYYNLRTSPGDSAYSTYRRNLFHIGHSAGTWFTPENLPLTAELMANVWRDASYFIWSMKYKYRRIRPYVIDPDVRNLEDTNWAAYPSGHAANSYINAFIYQELAPEFSDVFLKDAYDMAHSREILGVHYPSDSEASRIFARQFVNKLFENPDFRKDFEQVKKEWSVKAQEDFIRPVISPVDTKPNPSSCAKKCQ